MSKRLHTEPWKERGTALAATLAALLCAGTSAAEVTLDDSFGNDFQAVIPTGANEYLIEDTLGQYSHGDSNLFHSFSAFSIEQEHTATFSATKTPTNVIVRTTGTSASLIDGVLRSTIPGANLFLLNPNGIEVREGAKLDVRGSLHLSTADVLHFETGPEYGQARLPPDPSLLSADAPSAFGFTRSNVAPISLARTRRLVVPQGEVLSIVGGDPGDDPQQFGVSIIGNDGQSAQIDVGSGTLQIAAAKTSAEIPVDLKELDLDALEPGKLGDVFIESGAQLDAGRQFSAENSGNIVIRAERFVLDDARLAAIHDTDAIPDANQSWGIDIAATRRIEISNGAQILTFANKGGRAGDVRLNAESVVVSDGAALRSFVREGVGGDIVIGAETAVIDSGAQLWSRTQGTAGGNIVIDAGSVEIRGDGTELLSDPFAGTGGNIQVIADTAVIESGARLVSLAAGAGLGNTEQGGTLGIDARNVEIRGDGTELLSQPSVGSGGNIRIDANTAVVEGGAKLLSRSTSTGPAGDIILGAAEIVEIRGAGTELLSESSAGAGGNIQIDAPTIQLSEDASATSLSTDAAERGGDIWLGDIDTPAQTLRVSDRGRVGSIHSAAAGSGGNVEVSALNVELERGGQIFAETTGAGDSGNVIVHEADRVRVIGWADPLYTTAIGTKAGEHATGRGGLLQIDTRLLEVLDRGEIQTRTLGAGPAGDTRIVASERVTVRGGENGFAVISAGSETPDDVQLAGDGGTLTIDAPLLELLDGGQVTTSVQGPGNAGQLAVFADRIEISGAAGSNESGLFSQSISQSLEPLPEGTQAGDRGRGGNIFVEVNDRLELAAGGRISAKTNGPGDGGSIEIHAGHKISLAGGSEISALSLGDGAAGEVRIDAGKELRLTQGSRITTEANQSRGGKLTVEARKLVYLIDSELKTDVEFGDDNGGDILIDPDFVVLDSGDVTARASQGDGGAITIVTDHLFKSSDSLIDASSLRGGIDGEIVTEPPETEVIGQLTTLETSLVDASSLLTTPCAARTAPAGSFVVSSRRSLGASPDMPLSWLDIAGVDRLDPTGSACPAQATP